MNIDKIEADYAAMSPLLRAADDLRCFHAAPHGSGLQHDIATRLNAAVEALTDSEYITFQHITLTLDAK